MVIATVDGLASNLALTVPLGLVVVVGAFGPLAESWFVSSRPHTAPRSDADRERARRQRERARRRQEAA